MSKLWFQKEAENWNEALPVGNGFLGAMFFGGTASERIQVNEDSVWSGGFMDRVNPDAGANLDKVRRLLDDGNVREAEKLAARSMYGTYPHMRHYQTLGDVWIDFADMQDGHQLEYTKDHFPVVKIQEKEVSDYERYLDLETATGGMSYRTEGGTHVREYFASYPAEVIVCRIKADGKNLLNFEVSATRKDNRSGRGASYCDDVCALDDRTICLHGWQGNRDGIGFEMAVRVEASGGTRYSMGSRIIVEGAAEAVLYITGRTTYRSGDPHKWCIEALARACTRGVRELKAEHVCDYQKYFNAGRLYLKSDDGGKQYTVPERLARMREGSSDIGLINIYYDYARYLLISSSREHSLPSNLQGIWNEEFEPAWGSKYTININIEMNYWLAEKTGLSALHLPLIEHLKKMHGHGKDVAARMYKARGFCCHHNTDIWGDCAPQDNHTTSTIWPMGGAWLCLHLIEHYQYTKDEAFIQEYFNILRDSVLFFMDYMVQDAEGFWITGPSSSPENIYLNDKGEFGCLCMGPTMDIEILRELFSGFLEISAGLGVKDELYADVEKHLNGLPPLKIGKHGQIQEWRSDYEEIDRGHRHISQLFALYPGSQIRIGGAPELLEAAERTLERRLESGGGHTGWSKAWIILFYARLGKGKKAWQNLKELLSNATLDNLLDNHPPFQIDGNFGGAAGIMEMLVQDFREEVYLLGALPEELEEGRVTGVHLKCGCVIDFTWAGGHVVEVKLHGLRDGSVQIMDESRKSVKISFKKNEDKIIKF